MPYDPARAPITPVNDQERTWATLTHLLSAALAVVTPVPGIIVAVIFWQVKKGESAFLDDHGREAVNFWISVLLYSLVIIPLVAVLSCGLGACCTSDVHHRADRGDPGDDGRQPREFYRYPMTIRLV